MHFDLSYRARLHRRAELVFERMLRTHFQASSPAVHSLPGRIADLGASIDLKVPSRAYFGPLVGPDVDALEFPERCKRVVAQACLARVGDAAARKDSDVPAGQFFQSLACLDSHSRDILGSTDRLDHPAVQASLAQVVVLVAA